MGNLIEIIIVIIILFFDTLFPLLMRIDISVIIGIGILIFFIFLDFYTNRGCYNHSNYEDYLAYCGDDEDIEINTKNKDSIEFSIFVPTVIIKNETFLLSVWAYFSKDYEKILEVIKKVSKEEQRNIGISSDINIEQNSILLLKLEIKDLNIVEYSNIYWQGSPTNGLFRIFIPNKEEKFYLGKISIYSNDLLVAIINFGIEVDYNVQNKNIEYFSPNNEIFIPKTAFASYSSKDREEVLSRLQGIKKILPELDIFLDRLSLHSGDNWEEKLIEHVPSKDVFYLFWSTSSSQSIWVEKEWRLALEKRGLDYISPIPLDEPEDAPPPKELGSLHFNDKYLFYIKYEKLKK